MNRNKIDFPSIDKEIHIRQLVSKNINFSEKSLQKVYVNFKNSLEKVFIMVYNNVAP